MEDGTPEDSRASARRQDERERERTTHEAPKGVTAPRLPTWTRREGNYGLNSTFTGAGYLYYF